ncbi:NADP-dependent oxidoreductase domain-containing protein, partial [Cunninghamella echinulata]
WSPLSGGYLTGKNRKTARSDGWESMMKSVIQTREESDNEVILDKVIEIAESRKATPAQVALAWLFTKKYITSPILGISKEAHLYDLLQALELKLTEEETKSLDDLYAPRSVMPMGI